MGFRAKDFPSGSHHIASVASSLFSNSIKCRANEFVGNEGMVLALASPAGDDLGFIVKGFAEGTAPTAGTFPITGTQIGAVHEVPTALVAVGINRTLLPRGNYSTCFQPRSSVPTKKVVGKFPGKTKSQHGRLQRTVPPSTAVLKRL